MSIKGGNPVICGRIGGGWQPEREEINKRLAQWCNGIIHNGDKSVVASALCPSVRARIGLETVSIQGPLGQI